MTESTDSWPKAGVAVPRRPGGVAVDRAAPAGSGKKPIDGKAADANRAKGSWGVGANGKQRWIPEGFK